MVRQLTLKTLALLGFVVSITALLFGAVSIWAARQEVVLPTPSGLLPVGRTVHEWRDDSRNGAGRRGPGLGPASAAGSWLAGDLDLHGARAEEGGDPAMVESTMVTCEVVGP